jgi:hypothetical protein
MKILRMRSQLYVLTLMSAALGLTHVMLMPSVSMNQEILPASAKQGTLEMEVIAKVSIPSSFTDPPLTLTYLLAYLFIPTLACNK